MSLLKKSLDFTVKKLVEFTKESDLWPKKPAIEIEKVQGFPIPAWAIHPDNLDVYPRRQREDIRKRIERFGRLVDTDVLQLEAIGLPIPKQIGSLSYKVRAEARPESAHKRLQSYEWSKDPSEEYYVCRLSWDYPSFEIPPHFLLTFETLERYFTLANGERLNYEPGKLNEFMVQQNKAIYKDCEHPRTTYCIVGGQQIVEQAEAFFKAQGAADVVALFPGVWVTRDPYAAFKIINSRDFLKAGSDHNWTLGKLVPLSGYTPEQIKERDRQIYLFNQMMQGIDQLRNCEPGPDLYLNRWPDLGASKYFLTAPLLPEPRSPVEPVTLKIIPTADTRPALSAEFIDNLRAAKEPVIFALESTKDAQSFTITCDKKDRALVEHLLQSYVPECAALDHEPPSAGGTPYTVTAVLKHPYAHIKPLSQFALDPYRQLFTLFDATPEAQIQFKIMIQAPPRDAADHFTQILKERRKYADGERKTETSERLKQWKEKQPMWNVAVRFESPDPVALDHIAATFLRQYETGDAVWQFYSESQTPPMPFSLLSTTEITSLVHFPTKDVKSERLETTSMKTKLPPPLYTEQKPTAIAIGTATHRGKTATVTLPEQVRDRHVYIVGKSGMGKSTLITNMVAQDIQAGRGVAVVDPHGDLIDDILPYIPPDRIEDTILFNPSDKSHPVTLSPLSCADEDEYEQVVSDLVATMNRLSETWGIQIDYLFRAIFNTLVRVPGATFIDVHDIIASEKRRDQILSQVSHPRVLNFWYEQFDSLLPKSARLPILTRMERIVDSPTLSRILSSAESTLNFTDVIENKKIFLARLAKGEIGEDNTKLLGSILTSQIQLAIMRRARIAKEQRTPFYLYVDEFQNFTTPTFETILSEARKYQLSLTFAHQFVTQLSDQMRAAILGNVSTVVMFTLDVSDARKLEGQLGAYTHDDVAQLPKHHALCRPATSSLDTFSMETLAPLPRPGVNSTRSIIEHTRATYSATTAPAQTEPEVGKGTPEIPAAARVAAALVNARTPQPGAGVRLMKAEPLDGLPTKEKILLYVQQAEYLATPHLHTLCFSHYANENSRKANASAMLKELIEAKQLKMQPFGRGNIYFTGRTPNPTAHNVAVRELFVKLVSAGVAIVTAHMKT